MNQTYVEGKGMNSSISVNNLDDNWISLSIDGAVDRGSGHAASGG